MKGKGNVRPHPKGRPVDAVAVEEVLALLGDEPRRRDLLIEHLHKINDRYGHLSAAHLAALAQEMRLSQTEVYEVATFYHHFDVVDTDETPPPPITVRVCETLSCQMAGAQQLLDKLPGLVGPNVRVLAAPCIGRCAEAPAESAITYAQYRAQGGYKTWLECIGGKRDVDSVVKTMEDAGLRGLGGAGFPAGRKWRIVRQEPGPR
ncbi:MAG: NAD(P)H-dependent oxidoreductase subunit E, partial [Burkholderiales bacterium]